MTLPDTPKKSFAFVVPWFGKDAVGGAELECLNTALHLKKAGIKVEILTTCIKNFQSPWDKNFFTTGSYTVHNLLVRRFEVKKRNRRLFHKFNKQIDFASSSYSFDDYDPTRRIVVPPLDAEEEKVFMDEMIHCPSLYQYLKTNSDNYDYFIFIPYMFCTSYFGTLVCGKKSVIIPCLHQNELNAYLTCYKTMFTTCGKIIYHTAAEEKVAKNLYGVTKDKGQVIGEGVTDFKSDGERFTKKYAIDYPFLLYVGRRSEGKNTPLLIDYFRSYKKAYPKCRLKLLLIGDGNITILNKDTDSIKNFKTLPDKDKCDAYGAAAVVCQPSLRESFSLVIMESWLTGTPVIVHEHCEVTREHCIKSNGGLYFSNEYEFFLCIRYILEHPAQACEMGKNGRKYVLDNFNWKTIIASYLEFLS